MVSVQVPSIGIKVVICSLAKVLTANDRVILSIGECMHISKMADEFIDIFLMSLTLGTKVHICICYCMAWSFEMSSTTLALFPPERGTSKTLSKK